MHNSPLTLPFREPKSYFPLTSGCLGFLLLVKKKKKKILNIPVSMTAGCDDTR